LQSVKTLDFFFLKIFAISGVRSFFAGKALFGGDL
jgi:hypothetical protein